MPLHLDTPLLSSRALGRVTGRKVWLKLDALQPSGSFKLRGIGALCERRAREGARRFVSSSGGNAGIAAAYAGRQLGVAVTVAVPESASPRALELLDLHGAEVVVHGRTWHEANTLARSLLDEHSAFVHPFDDPLLWTGHSTLIDEVVRAGVTFDALVLSVGGGGLLAGMVEGLERHGLGHLPVVAVETEGAATLARSVEAGRRIELETITSLATSLGARQVCERAFELTRRHDVRCRVLPDREAVDACARFLDDHRVLVEPACGAALAAAYAHHADWLAPFAAPLVVVCGGAVASWAQIEAWRRALA